MIDDLTNLIYPSAELPNGATTQAVHKCVLCIQWDVGSLAS
jgi:hypothetical protein